MSRGRMILLMMLSLSLVLFALLFFLGGGRGTVRERLREPEGQKSEPRPEEVAVKKVRLFFLSGDDGRLHPEEREIVSSAIPEQEAAEVVAELIKGSREGLISPLPAEARIRQVYLTKEGTAYVDFSRELSDRHPSGTSAEMDTVYCVVNTLTFNFASIKRVFFLVDGDERETLSGHISLTKAFLPDFSMIAK